MSLCEAMRTATARAVTAEPPAEAAGVDAAVTVGPAADVDAAPRLAGARLAR
jgi:hypothetical protein